MTAARTVFLSYSSSDTEFARRLKSSLSNMGVTTLDAQDASTPGQPVPGALEGLLKRADIIAFVVPSREEQGRWALAELGAARAMGKRIVGIVPETSHYRNADVVRRLSSGGLIDASRWRDNDVAEMVLSAA